MSARLLRISIRARMAVISLLVALAAGCAQGPNWQINDISWFKKKAKPEAGPQIAAPIDRIKKMKELAEKAPEMSAEEKERESIELARSIQHEEDPIVRQQILRTLAVLPGTASTAVLTAAMNDADADVRIACCDAWGKHGGPEAAKALAKVLDTDTDLDVRLAAARDLGKVGDSSSVEALGSALDDKDPAMQFRAIVSLKQITGKDFGEDAGKWRDYVRGGSPEELSVAEKVKRWF